MPQVLNRRGQTRLPPNAVYVGRPSKWGNPFVIPRDGTRDQVINKYKRYLADSDLLEDIDELRGKDLVCWCAPEPCHADVLLQIANAPDPQDL